MNDEAPLRGFLLRSLLFLLLRILFVNWPQPAANAVTSVVDYSERVSGRGEATTDCSTVPQAFAKYALGLRLFRARAGRESLLWLAMTEAISGACWGLKD
ncbi:unnamed protein product [Sphagnum jensenii]|uniref:Secreted protein n=1 Tax=Sphagnum jensenii TaxID=128206 RepID=A0ABP1BXX5_9BRYO